MKIAVVGCGAVGSYYGSKWVRGGHSTHFLLRSDYSVVSQKGISVLSPQGDFTVRPQCHRDPRSIGPVDLVMIGLKSTGNPDLEHLLPPLVGAHTQIMTFQNGLGNVELLQRMFPSNRIYGALCFVCINRTSPGVIRHLAHGRIVMGRAFEKMDSQARLLADEMTKSGFEVQSTDDFNRAAWEKLLWNIPFNGLGVAGAVGIQAVQTGNWTGSVVDHPCLTTDRLLSDPHWLVLVKDLMEEVRVAAGRLGAPISESLPTQMIEKTRIMGAYMASTLLDFEQRKPLEVEAIFSEPLRRARSAGYHPVLLANLVKVLNRLNLWISSSGEIE